MSMCPGISVLEHLPKVPDQISDYLLNLVLSVLPYMDLLCAVFTVWGSLEQMNRFLRPCFF